jgi:hypothetical protein
MPLVADQENLFGAVTSQWRVQYTAKNLTCHMRRVSCETVWGVVLTGSASVNRSTECQDNSWTVHCPVKRFVTDVHSICPRVRTVVVAATI